jgi:hypothetical protein
MMTDPTAQAEIANTKDTRPCINAGVSTDNFWGGVEQQSIAITVTYCHGAIRPQKKWGE